MTIAGAAIKLKLWARDHGPGDSSDWWSIPLDEFPDKLDWLPVASALQDLERLARTPAVAGVPPAEDAALFDALAEYDRLAAIGQGLERREDVFRPDTPEANEATEAYQQLALEQHSRLHLIVRIRLRSTKILEFVFSCQRASSASWPWPSWGRA